jgi:hypothetical protein
LLQLKYAITSLLKWNWKPAVGVKMSQLWLSGIGGKYRRYVWPVMSGYSVDPSGKEFRSLWPPRKFAFTWV